MLTILVRKHELIMPSARREGDFFADFQEAQDHVVLGIGKAFGAEA